MFESILINLYLPCCIYILSIKRESVCVCVCASSPFQFSVTKSCILNCLQWELQNHLLCNSLHNTFPHFFFQNKRKTDKEWEGTSKFSRLKISATARTCFTEVTISSFFAIRKLLTISSLERFTNCSWVMFILACQRNGLITIWTNKKCTGDDIKLYFIS